MLNRQDPGRKPVASAQQPTSDDGGEHHESTEQSHATARRCLSQNPAYSAATDTVTVIGTT